MSDDQLAVMRTRSMPSCFIRATAAWTSAAGRYRSRPSSCRIVSSPGPEIGAVLAFAAGFSAAGADAHSSAASAIASTAAVIPRRLISAEV
ncbi:MAG: hypothetical protein KY433_05085 [Actinobacteria bacterium]|nr:hypothetical protein [Actinomycetota bacterium]